LSDEVGDDWVMGESLGISTLMSQCLVARTVEFDNEFEHRMPHRTTNGGGGVGPWLVSQVMWSNVMCHLDPSGLTVGELRARARTDSLSLTGLQRWGYLTVEPSSGVSRGPGVAPDSMVRPTRRGQQAKKVWRPLAGEIEARWRVRFGEGAVDRLRAALLGVVAGIDVALPDYLPVVHSELFTPEVAEARWPAGINPATHRNSDLSALLSYVLGAFTMDFERASPVSLPVAANLLRVLQPTGIRLRDLPGLAGVSKEAISWSLARLESHGLAVVESDPSAARGKVARLSSDGVVAQQQVGRRLDRIESAWDQRFGVDTMAELRAALERVVIGPDRSRSPLFDGLQPYPDGWRASVRPPATLPHHPTVLHRGGFPDGS
jgi:hypothetical protein